MRTACAARFGLDDELEWGRLPGAGLCTAAEELQRAIGALQHQQRLVLRLVDERKAYTAVGSRDAADWAAGRLGISRRAATEGIEVARELEAFPELADKSRAGDLSAEQTRPAVDLAPTAARAARTFDSWTVGRELRFKGSVPVDDGARLVKAIERAMPDRDPALRRALTVRDGHCRFGDCTSRRFLHGHHIDHWPAPTEMGNLALVCHSHHHALHEGGWRLAGDPFGELTAVHPDGRRSPPNLPQVVEDSG